LGYLDDLIIVPLGWRGFLLPTLLNHPSLLPKRDQLSRPAPYRFIVCAAGGRVVAHEGYDFFYKAVLVVPELDPKGSSPPSHWLAFGSHLKPE
jgi:hypothetical protein